jgi:antibiotic biosynthesis monooxygenase (ABM) superfamily enzyme
MNDSFLIKVRVQPQALDFFATWQAKLHDQIARAPGFVSLEIMAPKLPLRPEWCIIERFSNEDAANKWKETRKELYRELSSYAKIEEDTASGGVTELFIAQVAPDKEEEYKRWIAKIHHVESTFEGFQSLYVQSSATNWLTLLQFDTKEHLDCWLQSDERKALLEEAESLITSLDSHRVISGFAGWFQNIALPAVWKQTMLVLLVLYPIVMLQIRYLNPHLTYFSEPIMIFLGNIISVTLISWPLLPLAIKSLRWWLETKKRSQALLGTLVVVVLYIIEILVFVY